MLTDRFIRNAKPGKYADEDGLYLKVYESGTRAFFARSQHNGKDTLRKIGTYPKMGLAKARETLQRMKTHGIDDIPKTMDLAFSEYYDGVVEPHYRRPDEVYWMYHKYWSPDIGGTHPQEVTRAKLTAVLNALVRRGVRSTANHVLASGKRLFDYCEQRGWIDDNPLAKVQRRMVGGREVARSRTLSFDEIGDFLALLKSPDHNTSAGTRWALYFMLLTGCRSSEALVVGANGRIEETKSSRQGEPRPHQVPMTPHVRAALKLKPEDVPFSHVVLSTALRRLNQTFTPHDLRRTFASRMADLGVMPHVIEKLLNHKMEGVMATYNRSDYWPERVAAQRLWGARLRELRASAN